MVVAVLLIAAIHASSITCDQSLSSGPGTETTTTK